MCVHFVFCVWGHLGIAEVLAQPVGEGVLWFSLLLHWVTDRADKLVVAAAVVAERGHLPHRHRRQPERQPEHRSRTLRPGLGRNPPGGKDPGVAPALKH